MAGAIGNVKIIYKLGCGQPVMAPAFIVGGKLECPLHNYMEEIRGIFTYEWRAKCSSCKFSRWAGLSRPNAEIFANGHMRRNHGHHIVTEWAEHPEASETLAKRRAYRLDNAT